jgi:hypothetical protein
MYCLLSAAINTILLPTGWLYYKSTVLLD